MKATQLFGLVHGSPTKSNQSNNNGRKNSPSSSPVQLRTIEGQKQKSRYSPESNGSPDLSNPSSPSLKDKVDRPKPIRGSPIKRTASVDTIVGLYQTGQWPKDWPTCISAVPPSYSTPTLLTQDKATQTTEDWDDSMKILPKSAHKRSSSVGNGAEKKELKSSKKAHCQPRISPPGPGCQHPPIPSSSSSSSLSVLTHSKAVAIPVIHGRKTSLVRLRGSVEGPSQEVEQVLNISEIETSDLQLRVREPTPDGHRAPITWLFSNSTRSIDTQTPSSILDEKLALTEQRLILGEEGRNSTSYSNGSRNDSSSGSSHSPQSDSPTFPFIPCTIDSQSSSRDESPAEGRESDKENTHIAEPKDSEETLVSQEMERLALKDTDEMKIFPRSSPKPNKSFSFGREPPDGCEKIKLVDEAKKKKVPTATLR